MNRSFQEIIERYKRAKSEGKLISLSQPSTGNIRNRLIEYVNSDKVSDEDRKQIVTFLPNNINNKTLVSHLADIDELFFRPISYFLAGKTKKPDTHSVRPVLDMLVDFDIKKSVSYDNSSADDESLVQGEDSVNNVENTISINDIESGENTNISVEKDNTSISISKVKSGKDTNLDI